MKKRFIVSLSILAVFAFAIAAYAFTRTNTANPAPAADCCKSKDSCPMKMKGHEAGGEHAKMSCCCKTEGQHAEGTSCECCGDSCPMKKGKGTSATEAEAAPASDGKNCCDNCACCKGKKETSV